MLVIKRFNYVFTRWKSIQMLLKSASEIMTIKMFLTAPKVCENVSESLCIIF